MNQERLKEAIRVFQTLEHAGISDALRPHAGDRLIAWGEVIKDLPEGVQALDLRSFMVLEPTFARQGLTTPWASSELSLGITHLATFFDITEREAFFIFGPLQTPAFTHAIERIQAILEHASEPVQERLSVRQHAEFEKLLPLGSLSGALAEGQQTQERAESLDRLVTPGTEADPSSHRNSAPRTRMDTYPCDLPAVGRARDLKRVKFALLRVNIELYKN